jgi:hypothetical protein
MPALTPTDGPLYVVRWLRLDGRNAKHRYFRREHDARRFLDRLVNGGWTARLYVSETTWKDVR